MSRTPFHDKDSLVIKWRTCKVCLTFGPSTKHHILPRSRGGKKTSNVCRPCHDLIHATFSNGELNLENWPKILLFIRRAKKVKKIP